MNIDVLQGDCRDRIKDLPDASVDACVTDPPYGLKFMGKHWDGPEAVAFDAAFWADVLRVLKPGAHLLAFGGTRTYHRLAVAIEDAGFEIRDCIAWVYGSGFPKSHDVAKAIDKADGATGKTTATEAAQQWQGWGSALKPALEPVVVARKPLIGTIADNVTAHGTGALNIDGCRIAAEARAKFEYFETGSKRGYRGGIKGSAKTGTQTLGRWPANLIHDGSPEVLAGFPESGGQAGAVTSQHGRSASGVFSDLPLRAGFEPRGDSGTAARFFYTAKADKADRLGSGHPTVKPVDLMAYLCRLVTPPGGLVLDPFAGSGSTGMACLREGFNAVLIEREAEYVADIRRRLAHVTGEDMPLLPANVPRVRTGRNSKAG